jgi:hypothetical protein
MKPFNFKILPLILPLLFLGVFLRTSLLAATSPTIKTFVERLYQQSLDRTPDQDRLNAWVSALASGEITGEEVVKAFLLGKDLQARGLSNEDFVTILYRAIFDREPDQEDYKGWLKALASGGRSREEVVAAFILSQEFSLLCNQYNIKCESGSKKLNEGDQAIAKGNLPSFTPEWYVIYSLILFLCVYTAPALTFFPELLFSARLLPAIPIVSSFIVWLIFTIFSLFDIFNHDSTVAVSLIFLTVSIVRIYLKSKVNHWEYEKHEKIVLLFILIIFIPFFTRMGLDSFSTDDEMYSWNMWAVQHYLGENIDYYYTGSPYPQLFSIIIAYCYTLLGSIELQMVVKGMLTLYSLSMILAVAFIPKISNFTRVALTCFSILLLIYGLEIQHYFKQGLADPVMSAALVVSVALFMRFLSESETKLLWLSLLSGVVAAFTKQAALVWVLFSLPLLLILYQHKNKYSFALTLAAGLSICSALFWILGEGAGFHQNRGVVEAAQQGRGFLEQFIYSSKEYFLKKPLIFLTVTGAFLAVQRKKEYRGLFYTLIIPSLVVWFLWGAYSLRLGMHVVTLCFLIILCTDFSVPLLNEKYRLWQKIGQFVGNNYRILGVFFVVFGMSYSGIYLYKITQQETSSSYFEPGGRRTINKYFAGLSDWVYSNLYENKNILLWVPTNYIYGIFYGHTEMIRPNFAIGRPYDQKAFLSELKENKPDYLFSGGVVDFGGASAILYNAANECPSLFEEIQPRVRLSRGFRIYKMNKSQLIENRCGM